MEQKDNSQRMLYTVTVEQVSQSMNRYFNVFVNSKPIGVTSNKPSFGSKCSHDKVGDIVFENAEKMARRVIIHSFEDDIDVFANGSAKISFGKIKWAE